MLRLTVAVLALASTTGPAFSDRSAEPNGSPAITGQAAFPSVAAQGADVAQEDPTQGNLGRPYSLPPAPRSRMHECGIEWQKMKMSGAAEDKTWRVFASVCLTTKKENDEPIGPKAVDHAKDR